MAAAAIEPLNFYVSTLHEPEAVLSSTFSHFLSSDASNIVLNKGTRLEVNALEGDQLVPRLSIPIDGRIVLLRSFRPTGYSSDVLFVSTEKYNFCFLRYNTESGLVETLAKGSLRDKCCRPADSGQLLSIDPEGRSLLLHVFQGLLKIIPVETATSTNRQQQVRFKEPFNVRLEELQVYGVEVMHDGEAGRACQVAILHETVLGKREIVSHTLEMDKKRLSEGTFRVEVDESSHMLIAVPKPRGGLLVIAETCVQYYRRFADGREEKLAAAFALGVGKIMSCTRIDSDGFRYLLGDGKGALYLLVLQAEENTVTGLKLEMLGRSSSIASTLEYIDAGKVFLGSRLGPNRLVRLSSERRPDGAFFEELQLQETLSPILDMCLVDSVGTGHPDTLVACAGAFEAGGLAVLRRGVGASGLGAFSLDAPVTGAWPLDISGKSHVALGTLTGTELLRVDIEAGQVEHLSAQQYLLSGNPSILVAQLASTVFQVTSSAIHYTSILHGAVRRVWMPQDGCSLLSACILPEQSMLVACISSGFVLVFRLSEGASKSPELMQVRTVKLGGVPSAALALHQEASKVWAFVGLWSSTDAAKPFSVVAIDLSSGTITSGLMNLTEVPRSIAACKLTSMPFLFVGLPSGAVAYGRLALKDGAVLEEVRESLLASQPAELVSLPNGGLFIRSDRPCIVVPSNSLAPHFLSVPLQSPALWCPLGKDGIFLAADSNGEFLLGRLEDVGGNAKTRLHVNRVAFGETLRRIVHLPKAGLFAALASSSTGVSSADEGEERASVCIFNDRTYDLVDRYELPKGESAQCLTFVSSLSDSLLVGTAVPDPNQPSATAFHTPKGHILMFRITSESRLSLVHSHFLPGAFYSMAWTQDRLLATINGSVGLYRWEETGKDMRWRQLAQHHGQVLGVHLHAMGKLVAVADMMRSVGLLSIGEEEAEGQKIVEVARDYHTGWATHTCIVDPQHVLLADDHGNLSQLVLRADPNFLTERLTLDHATAFHIGSIINSIQPGSLSELGQASSSNGPFTSSFLFATACGTLGSLAVLRDPSHYDLLSALQKNILAVSKTAGQFNHTEWRSFYNEKRALPAHPHFIDGDVIQRFAVLPAALQLAVVQGGSHQCSRLPGNKSVRDIAQLVDLLASH